MFGKDQLHVDLTNVGESDQVISFIRSANGENITSTDVGSKKALDVYVANPISVTGYSDLLESAVVVGVTAVALPATALTGRKAIQVENMGSRPIFIGSSGVLTTTGVKVNPGSVWEEDCAEACVVYAIGAAAAQDVRVIEFK
jgi:hypothetical protein